MPIKKKKVSELTPVDNLSGLWALGVKLINGVQTSVKVSFTLIQTAYQDAIKAISDAKAATEAAKMATSDMRKLEATVEDKEEERESFYSRSQAMVQGWSNDEQGRKEAEAERVKNNTIWQENEDVRIENNRIWKEREDARIVEEQLRKNAENERKVNEGNRQKQEEEREKGTIAAILSAEKATGRLNTLSDHRDEIRDGYWWRWNEETGEWYNTGEIAKGNVMYATFEVTPSTAILTMITDEEYTGANFELDENGILTVVIQ